MASARSKPQEPVKPGDIFYLDQPRLRASGHPHYVIVLKLDGDKAFVNFLSSQVDCFNEAQDILIRTSDEEFPSTGLEKDTYLINEPYARQIVPIVNLLKLRPQRTGFVTGYFKARIEEYFGEELK